MPNKRKAEMARPPVTVMSVTSVWSREQICAEMDQSQSAHDEAYKRGDDMPPRYRRGHVWQYPVAGYAEWQRRQLAKAAEAQRKLLASKARKREREASATANEA
jgi:hypothetical protein